MTGARIDKAGIRLDRKRTVAFRFNGRSYQGFAGDTLASAVLAAGDTVLSRSWKYHRPRAILTCGVEEPAALVQLETGAWTIPNAKMPEVELYEGLQAESALPWPSPGKHFFSVNRWFTPLLTLDTHVKFVQYIKLCQPETGLGKEWVRAPRLPIAGEDRERVLAIIRDGIKRKPKLA